MSRVLALGLTLLVAMPPAASAREWIAAGPDQQPATQPPPQQPPPPPPPPQKPEEEVPIYEEAVVVSASKVEQQLVNAPATVSVITSDVIQSTPATNYAELLRSVPGVNISQTSARDFNITIRGAASTLATSQLALIDGRSLYLDFFGFVAWDLLPMNPNEIRQIEVIRGPASAVWGANALERRHQLHLEDAARARRRQRDDQRRRVRREPGEFETEDRRVVRDQRDARARGQRSLGLQGVGRPVRVGRLCPARRASIPGSNTPYPPFGNTGTSQPKFDTRVDYDAPDGAYKLAFAGGYAATEGIIHTGIGPFDMDIGRRSATARCAIRARRCG